MAKGIKLPIQISSTGGSVAIESVKMLRQNILYAIRPASSAHPWSQNITPKEDMIFDIADNQTASLYTSHIYKVFKEFEKLGLAKLPPSNGVRIVKNNDGETEIEISYIDLEDNKTRKLKVGRNF